MKPELRNRLVFGALLATAVIGALVADIATGTHGGVLALAVVAVVLGCREFRRMARVHAAEVRLAPMVAVCLALVLEAHLHAPWINHGWLTEARRTSAGLPVALLILGFGLAWVLLTQMVRYATERFIVNLGATLFGMVYIGVSFNLLGRLALIEGPPDYYGLPETAAGYAGRGGQLLLVFIAAVKLGDTTAYFGGRLFGRHKMSPRISPGKTWEGFACSFIGAIGGSYLVAWLLSATCAHPPFNGWWQPAVWGLVLGPLGVLGDLAESAIKRDAAVKDSGAMVPGFGGLLDILDALIVAAPVGYLLALAL